jgi:hypothetical protein
MLNKSQIKSTIEADKKIGKYDKYESYVCIPMSIDKKPIVSWKGITKTPKSKFLPEHNIAILTEKINNITVIDIDNPKPNKKESDGMKLYEEFLDKYNQNIMQLLLFA